MPTINFLISEPSVSYCEEPTGSIIARPGYAISNLPIIIVGLHLLSKKEKLAKGFGILSILMGTMSFSYDLSYMFVNQLFDLLSMMLFALFVLDLNLSKLGLRGISVLTRATLLITAGLTTVLFRGMTGNIMFSILITLILVSEIAFVRSGKAKKYSYSKWIIASILFVIGLLAWYLDYSKTWCDPMSIFNGRAVYHYLASFSIYFYYLFYRQFEQHYKFILKD